MWQVTLIRVVIDHRTHDLMLILLRRHIDLTHIFFATACPSSSIRAATPTTTRPACVTCKATTGRSISIPPAGSEDRRPPRRIALCRGCGMAGPDRHRGRHPLPEIPTDTRHARLSGGRRSGRPPAPAPLPGRCHQSAAGKGLSSPGCHQAHQATCRLTT